MTTEPNEATEVTPSREQVLVDAVYLRQVLQAFHGPSYMLMELKMTMGMKIGPRNAVDALTDQFNAALQEKH